MNWEIIQQLEQRPYRHSNTPVCRPGYMFYFCYTFLLLLQKTTAPSRYGRIFLFTEAYKYNFVKLLTAFAVHVILE